ncbi:6282_t:CDS:1 [Entrophospora sp. SA101]|nr:6282_t:CDS:1 [Entrophospora sp. SA101]
MSSFDISIILGNKGRQLPKPINNRPGYDMKYIQAYISHYFSFSGERYNQFFEIERLYDALSVIRPNETPKQWAIRVRVPLQELVSERKGSFYHRYCLFGSYGKGRLVDFDYYRPRIHRSHMAICLDCMKLTKIDDVKPRKSFDYGWQRFIEIVESKDLMQYHWDHECDKPKTEFGHARIIQRVWRRFQEKEPSNARLARNSLPNDNTPDDKKFLTLIPHKIKNPVSLDQIKIRLNKEYAEYIKKYNRFPYNVEFEVSMYQEYIIPYDWIIRKKKQLRYRFGKCLQQLEL